MIRNASRRAPPGSRQRGSALLIVFVFAAMIGIMLYAEMPVAVFEAKREKEQLLIDRGNEYAHAVKLFVRKFGRYPGSIDQLEDTNRMRFLRHRFKDPFTGKDDWRLLHAGPGGMLIDSKVNPLGANAPGNAPGSTSAFGSTSTNAASGFGQSGFGSTSTNASSSFGQAGFGSSSQSAGANSPDAVVVPPTPQRPPAISASGGVPASESANGEVAAAPVEGDQSPTAPLPTPAQTDQLAASPTAESGAQASQNTAPGQNATPVEPAAQNGMNTGPNAQTPPGPGMGNQGPLSTRPQQALLAGSGSPGSPMGQINSGGIAGVASKAKGQSIKTVNDQTDYSLWEFYYDPTKDTTRGAPGQGMSGMQQSPSGQQPQNSLGQNPPNQATPTTNPAPTTSTPAFPANPSQQ